MASVTPAGARKYGRVKARHGLQCDRYVLSSSYLLSILLTGLLRAIINVSLIVCLIDPKIVVITSKSQITGVAISRTMTIREWISAVYGAMILFKLFVIFSFFYSFEYIGYFKNIKYRGFFPSEKKHEITFYLLPIRHNKVFIVLHLIYLPVYFNWLDSQSVFLDCLTCR